MSDKETDDKGPIEPPIWRIKYRPKSLTALEEIRPEIVQQVKGFIELQNLPHLMLVGPKGSGKTLIAEILARELLDQEFGINCKILFADDPIGKDERREAKKQGRTSARMVGSGAGTQKNYRPFIQIRVRPFVSMQKFGDSPFKVLIIKNFHALDVEQQAFRRIMEQYSKNCRMILISDKISGIIDPIVSRCQLLMVPYTPEFRFNKYIKDICENEKIPIKLDAINYVRNITKSNIGEALDILQLTHDTYKFLTIDNISKTFTAIADRGITNLIQSTFLGRFSSIKKSLRTIFKEENLDKNAILLALSRKIANSQLEREVQAQYLNMIADTDFDSIDSSSHEIQLYQLLTKMALIGNKI